MTQPKVDLLPNELTTEVEWKAGWEVLRHLRSDLPLEDFLSRREQLLSDGYRFLGVALNSRVVGVASVTISPHAKYGRELLIHDMQTLPEFQGMGVGSSLLNFIDSIAAKEFCRRCLVHSRLERQDAHRFYEEKGGYQRYSLGLVKIFGRDNKV